MPRAAPTENAVLDGFDRLLSFYPFAEIDRAFADAHSGRAIKPVLLIGEP